MLLSGLRSGELLTLDAMDIDIGARWVRVMGKGGKERRVPLDVEVAGLIQTYLLTETRIDEHAIVPRGERPEQRKTVDPGRASHHLPIPPTQSRSARRTPARPAAHLRHTFCTAMAEAGVDLAVMQALLGHAHVDSTARYIHLAPTHVKAEFDAARKRLRART